MSSNIRNFKAVGDNLFIIAQKILEDEDICKLLYYTDSNPLSSEHSMTEDERYALLHKNVLLVPKVPENDDIKGSYILILYDGFNINLANSEFKDADLLFIVVSPPENWVINDSSLRPFLIMSRIDELFGNKKIANIGKLQFVKADRFVLNSQLTGYGLTYSTYEFN
jgi:hypothetical protein